MAGQETRSAKSAKSAKRATRGGNGKSRKAVSDTSRRTGSTVRDAASSAGAAPAEAVEEAQDRVPEDAGTALESASPDLGTSRREQPTLREELGDIVRETAIEILGPVARNATRQAAKYAVKKGPQLITQTIAPRVRDSLGPAIEDAGGPGELARDTFSRVTDRRDDLLSKVGIGREGGDGSSQPGTKGWRVPAEEGIDVAVPLETAYDQFTHFEEFAKVMSRGEKVDERPNERIEWRSDDGAEGTGVITFHRLSDRLTRVMVTYDSQPHGLVDRTTSALGMSRRGLRADLMRFKAFAEMNDEDEYGSGGDEAYDEEEYDQNEEPEGEEEQKPAARSRRPRTRRPAAKQQRPKTGQRPKTRQRR